MERTEQELAKPAAISNSEARPVVTMTATAGPTTGSEALDVSKLDCLESEDDVDASVVATLLKTIHQAIGFHNGSQSSSVEVLDGGAAVHRTYSWNGICFSDKPIPTTPVYYEVRNFVLVVDSHDSESPICSQAADHLLWSHLVLALDFIAIVIILS